VPPARTRVLAFYTPTVKGGDLILPFVAASGERGEMVATIALMRDCGERVVEATDPAELLAARQSSNRRSGASSLAEAAAAGQPLEKPRGGVP